MSLCNLLCSTLCPYFRECSASLDALCIAQYSPQTNQKCYARWSRAGILEIESSMRLSVEYPQGARDDRSIWQHFLRFRRGKAKTECKHSIFYGSLANAPKMATLMQEKEVYHYSSNSHRYLSWCLDSLVPYGDGRVPLVDCIARCCWTHRQKKYQVQIFFSLW